ncbi:hypothetical protein [Paenibacillus sp. KS-LC4]|uniref:hypothetical protein n=1 Tax=Paenibacillus sp. KS-LC4 TaxID=2979727 RepID=UPI0030D2E770
MRIAIGYNGIRHVSRLSGLSRQTLQEGVKELIAQEMVRHEPDRSRRSGGGRKSIQGNQSEILDALTHMLEGFVNVGISSDTAVDEAFNAIRITQDNFHGE